MPENQCPWLSAERWWPAVGLRRGPTAIVDGDYPGLRSSSGRWAGVGVKAIDAQSRL